MKNKKKISPSEKPTSAFVLSLIAGILIAVSGIVLGVISELISKRIGNIMIAESSFITFASIAYPIAGLKIIMGAIVIIGATTLFKSELLRMAWGVAVLVLSIIALMFSIVPPGPIGLIGAVLGIIGGALALGWKA
jgi:hypothetical protein